MSVILVSVSLIAVILGFALSSSRQVFGIQLIYMWFIFAFNTSNADYLNYAGIYNRIGSGTAYTIANYEEGFVILCMLCNRLGMSYQQFIMVIATICTVLYAVVIELFMKGRAQNVVTSLFIVSLYWIMICQYRSYVAFLLSLIGLYFLISRDDLKGTISFVVFVMLGFSFHRAAVLYLLLLVVKRFSVKKAIIYLPIMMLPLIILRLGFFSNVLSHYVAAYKINSWVYTQGTRSLLGVALLIVLRIVLLTIELIIMKSDNGSDKYDLYRFETFVVKIMIICFAFMALEIFDANYERLFRIPLILSMMMFSKYGYEHRVTVDRVPLQYMVLGGYFVLYMGAFYISNNSWFYSVLIPILTNNALLGTCK